MSTRQQGAKALLAGILCWGVNLLLVLTMTVIPALVLLRWEQSLSMEP